ncbi:MAG: hypothetical protein RLP44_18830 [Aggregatilineales bacterium]
MDTTQIILDNEHATLMYHPDTKIVHHVFHRTVQGVVFREVLNEGLEVFRKYGAHKWLSDDRMNAVLPEADTEWAKTIWFPQVLEAGWQHWAVVVPPRAMAMLNIKEFIDTYRPFGLRAMLFTDDKPALKWLELAKDQTPKTVELPVED